MTQSAGDMVIDALKKLIGQLIKLMALLFAFLIETIGKLCLWISDKIKQNAR